MTLLPCPFCGGEAERLDFEMVSTDPNAGGSCISCTKCGASSPVHFEFKENLYPSWNERASLPQE
jgi:Lar family restriction alleviation protein